MINFIKSNSDIPAILLSFLWLLTLNFSKITIIQYAGIVLTIILFTLVLIKNILIHRRGPEHTS